jgi:hypothetical protein
MAHEGPLSDNYAESYERTKSACWVHGASWVIVSWAYGIKIVGTPTKISVPCETILIANIHLFPSGSGSCVLSALFTTCIRFIHALLLNSSLR